MEKIHKTEELPLAELKEQRTELLPDRIEMRRRRGWRNTLVSQTSVSVANANQNNNFLINID